MTNVEQFESITKSMLETFKAKNSDYGNSFDNTCDRFGLVAAVTRMFDKMERLAQFVIKGSFEVNESVKDTLLDLANYCILTYMWICKKEKN